MNQCKPKDIFPYSSFLLLQIGTLSGQSATYSICSAYPFHALSTFNPAWAVGQLLPRKNKSHFGLEAIMVDQK